MENKETLIEYWTDYLLRNGLDKYHAKKTAIVFVDELEEVYNKAPENSAGVWVKASERLPVHLAFWNIENGFEKDCSFPVRMGRKYGMGELYDESGKGDGSKYCIVIEGQNHFENDFSEIEWFDESIPKEDKPITLEKFIKMVKNSSPEIIKMVKDELGKLDKENEDKSIEQLKKKFEEKANEALSLLNNIRNFGNPIEQKEPVDKTSDECAGCGRHKNHCVCP